MNVTKVLEGGHTFTKKEVFPAGKFSKDVIQRMLQETNWSAHPKSDQTTHRALDLVLYTPYIHRTTVANKILN